MILRRVLPQTWRLEAALGRLRRARAALQPALAWLSRPWVATLLARAGDAATLAVIVFFYRIIGAKFLRAPFGFDERYFVHEGWSVTKGLVPYRDLQEFKPPMVFFMNALAIKLFGVDQMAYRYFFSILSVCVFVTLAIALLSRGTSRLLVGGLVVLMIDHFLDRGFHDQSINNAETLSLDFFLLGCGILLVRTRWERTQQVIGAAVLALSPLSKEPMAFAAMAAWLTFLLLYMSESTRPHAARRFALYTIAGVAGVAATWLIYMLATHSLGAYAEQMRLNVAYVKNYARQVNWIPKTPEGMSPNEQWKRLKLMYVNAPHIGVFIALVAAPVFLWERRKRMAGVAAVATAAATLYGVTVGKGFASHYFIMAMAGMFFVATIGALALDDYARRVGVPMRRWVGATWLVLALLGTYTRFSDERKKYDEYKAPPPTVNATDLALVQANSKRSDRIWTLGDPLLYVYSDRVTAFREGIMIDELIDYYPGATDEERLAGQRAEMMAKRPKLILFGQDPVSYDRKRRYIRAMVMPFIKEAGYVKVSDKLYLRP